MLLQKEIDVCEATSGTDVINCLSAGNPNNFHALLLDLQLPGMTGFEVLEWIKEKNLSLPVIAFTANVIDRHTMHHLLKAGFSDVVPKPFQPEQLYEKIFRHVQH